MRSQKRRRLPAHPAAAAAVHTRTQQRARRIKELRRHRHEVREGNRTIIQELGRTIIREGGRTFIRHNHVDRFRRHARNVRVEHRDGNTITVIERPNGVRIITVVDDDGHLLRRVRRDPDGREVVLIENRPHAWRRGRVGFIVDVPPPVIRIPRDRYIVDAADADRARMFAALMAPPVERLSRRYTLNEVLYNHDLREWMPRVDLNTINFESGSWEVTPDEAARLAPIADAIRRVIARNPDEVFLIAGHTDTVGDPIDNLSLSDRRAEAVAEVLTEDYGIPPENMVTHGYGEEYLKVLVQGPVRANRRVTIRRITPLLARGG